MDSLKSPRFAATLALHSLMDQAQIAEISQRVRGLKEASRETNRSIGDYCGVTERTVAGWLSPREPKPMTWEHAEKVSELFQVDVDWLWRGREKGPTPDMLAALNGSSQEQLDRIESKVDQILTNWDARWALLEADDAPKSAQGKPRSARGSASKERHRKAR